MNFLIPLGESHPGVRRELASVMVQIAFHK